MEEHNAKQQQQQPEQQQQQQHQQEESGEKIFNELLGSCWPQGPCQVTKDNLKKYILRLFVYISL